MAFHEVRFPTSLSFGSFGGPERRTDVVTLANGFEERNTPWEHSRRRYDAGLSMRSLEDLQNVIAFFEARRGQLHAFRWKDWADYKSGPAGDDVGFQDQVIATGDGAQTSFVLTKTYSSGPTSYARSITKPVVGTVRIGVDQIELEADVDYTLDETTGLIVFVTPPGQDVSITAGFEFDVPVRFDTDRIQTSLASFQAGEVPNVPVVEVRV